MAKRSQPNLEDMISANVARDRRHHAPPAAVSEAALALAETDKATILVERELLEPNPAQPRKRFAPEDLEALGQSLRADGQLQALVVRPHPDPDKPGRYQIVSGERRWQAAAARYGGIPRLRVTVRDLTDEECLRLALVENVQRKDLDTIEIAQGLEALQLSTQVDSTELARMVGFSKQRVSQLLALLRLPKSAQKAFDELGLNEKHGRALLQLEGRAQSTLLREIADEKLSGNEALRRAEAARKPEPPSTSPEPTSPRPNVSRETAHAAPIAELQRGQGFDQGWKPAPRSEPRQATPEPHPTSEKLRAALQMLAEARLGLIGVASSPSERRDILALVTRGDDELQRIREELS